MDGDELIVLAIGLVVSLAAGVRWYARLARVGRPGRRGRNAVALALTPPACLLYLLAVLLTAADPQVRRHGSYVLLFLAAGGSVLAATSAALPVVLGVSVRADAVERSNGPAAAVACGSLAAATVVYAGANVGTGDTIWTTLGPAALGWVALSALTLAHAVAGGLTESVTVDRDPAAAARAVGLHAALAVVLARAVAGNFVSAPATVTDFGRRGWPVVPLVLVSIAVDRSMARRPWSSRRAIAPAVVVAVGYLGAAAAWALACPA